MPNAPWLLIELSAVGLNRNRDTASRPEHAGDSGLARGAGGDNVVKDVVDDGLMEGAVVAVGEKVELERLAFDAALVGDIADRDVTEVGLTRDRADGGELGAVEGDPVVTPRVRILKCLEDGLGGVGWIIGLLRPEEGEILVAR